LDISGRPKLNIPGRITEIHKIIYTTNAIESIDMSLRKVIKARRSFPVNETVTKLFNWH